MKLLKIENTNIFAITKEEKNENCVIEGIIRIEKDCNLDFIKTFEPKEEEWYKEVKVLKDNKRKEIYKETENTLKVLSMSNLLLHYFKESNRISISSELVKELLGHVFTELSKKKLLEYYTVASYTDVIVGAMRIPLFRVDLIGEMIFLKDTENLEDLLLKYPLDKVIVNMIKEFEKVK